MAADEPPAQQGSADGKLNSALFGFAESFVKQELLQLSRECDDHLGRDHVPKLRALYREVDKERDAFEHHKERLIRGLREKLQMLQADDATVDAITSPLAAMAPKYLGVIPSASTLAIRPPTPLMTPVRDNNSYFNTVLGSNAFSLQPAPPGQGSAPPAIESAPNPRESVGSPGKPLGSPEMSLVSPGVSVASPKPMGSIDGQVQAQVMAESSMARATPKRPRAQSRPSARSSPAKRPKREGERIKKGKQLPDISRKVAFPNLETGECIFRHSARRGFFVIRCDRPECGGFFTDPPLVYNRAIKHFQKHGDAGPDNTELTNELIFDRFACQIEGCELASKYWIREHLGSVPHTFEPGKTRRRKSHADTQDSIVKSQEDDRQFTHSAKGESEEELEDETPRRRLRTVPRPDYAEMVANKDPWNASDAESERTSHTTKNSRASSISKRKPTKVNEQPSPSAWKTINSVPLVSNLEEEEPEVPNPSVIHQNSGLEDPRRVEEAKNSLGKQHRGPVGSSLLALSTMEVRAA
ncbi:hypothetical protein F4780DRAFT_91737 [Xylariomycetidae sp. FL0641]|nr:hypothetical protein F4780DRAFT_91737 [Xylariomycetidae sp. FL0641]